MVVPHPRRSLPPGTTPSYGVNEERDVVFCTVDGYWSEAPDNAWGRLGLPFKPYGSPHPLELKLDIYTPDADTSEARPLLFMLHGGAYFIGHKDEPGQLEWCRYFASLGYVAVSADYRMGYRLTKPDFARAEQDARADAEKALAYVLGREDLRIDPDRVYLAGTSAGAAISLLLGYDASGESALCRIRAIANLWGYVHDLDLLERGCIPILSFQSELDPMVPYREGYPMRALTGKMYGTCAIHERAQSLGIPCEHHPCPEKRHKLHLDDKGRFTPRFYEIRDAMAVFFAGYGAV